MRIALKFALVAVLSLPVAGCFTYDANLCIGVMEVPFLDQIGIVFFLVVWALLVYWATRATTKREAAVKTCRAFALAAFLLPVASIVFAITGPSDAQAFIPAGAFIAFCLLFGGIMGWLGLGASRLLAPDRGNSPKKDSFQRRRRTL